MPSPFDVIIIGGGINGCALAREAARAGLAVALLEKNDFGAGVTSRATRLIHGGLRYLESFQFGLVRESLRDRRVWIDDFPGQSEPLRFLIPIYADDRRAPWYIRVGLNLYGLLARDPRLSEHSALRPAAAEAMAPALDRNGLRAAFLYWDGQATFPERVCLEMALQAEEAGALVRNHAPVEAFLREGSRVAGVRAGGEEYRARLTINAAGAWIDRVAGLLGRESRMLTRLNGAHIVVRPFEGGPPAAVYREARSDGRPFFIVPWNDALLIGTTETPYDGDPERVLPLDSEIEYLLREANLLFPGAKLARDSVLYAYAGSRPLVRATGSNLNAASRDHRIHDHAREDGVEGLLTLVGGKLTTAPSFAAEALRAAAKKLGKPLPRKPNAPAAPPDGYLAAEPRLARVYGPRTPELLAYLDAEPARREPVFPGAPASAGEVAFALERERAATLGDVLLRRTMLAYHADYRPEWAESVSRAVADRLHWSESRRAEALADYESELAASLLQR